MENMKDMENTENTPVEDYKYHIDQGTLALIRKSYNSAIEHYNQAISLNPDCADAYIHRGRAFYTIEDYDRTFADLAEALRLDPNCAEAYFGRGTVYDAQGDHDQALANFTEAIRLKPDYADAYYNRGLSYARQSNMDQAMEDFNQAIQINPKYAYAYELRGVIYASRGLTDMALTDFNEVVRLEPQNAHAYLNRGHAYTDKGECDLAIKDLNQSIRLEPQNAEAYYSRGRAFAKKKNYKSAIADFNQAIQINPKYTEAYYGRGKAYAEKGDHDRAIVNYTETLRLDPNHDGAYIDRGIAYGNKEDYDRAIADFTEAIRLDPNDVGPYNNRGNAYAEKGENYDQAIADLNQALQLDPRCAYAYNNRGKTYLRKGDYDRAIADLTEALQLDPEYANAYNNRGKAYTEKKDYDRAIKDFDKAIHLEQQESNGYYNRGIAYGKKGDYERAMGDLNQAIHLNPQNADIYLSRGEMYRSKGECDRAIKDFDKAIQLDPHNARAYMNRGAVYSKKGTADYNQAVRLDPALARIESMENIENTVCRSDSSFLGYSARNPLIIAELGTGHNGDRKKALELIDAASEAGTRCIKVQIVYADEILHPNTGTVMLPGGPVRLYDRFKSIEVSPDFFLELKEYSESKGLMFLATPFGLQSARELRALNPYAIKIASPELNHIPLLKEVASYGIPVILSSGVSTVADIEQAVTLLSASAVPLCLLHCVTAYPAPETAYNVRVLRSLNAIFGIPVGISDHSLDPYTVPVLAVAMGAAVIEKHFCLSRSDSGLDDPIALTPKDFAALVQAVTRAANTEPETVIAGMAAEKGAAFVNAVLGSGVKKLAAAEAENYGRTSRSIHAVRDLIPGTTLGESDITIVRTEKTLRVGVPPSFDVIGCTIKQFIPAGEGIRFEDLY